MTIVRFSLDHLMAFMIALAALGHPPGPQAYVIEEAQAGARPRIIRATRTPAGFALEAEDRSMATEEKVDGRGVVARRTVDSKTTETVTVASTPHPTRFTVTAVDDESPLDLAEVFPEIAEAPLDKAGVHVLRRGDVEIEVERMADTVVVLQRGTKRSFTIRPAAAADAPPAGENGPDAARRPRPTPESGGGEGVGVRLAGIIATPGEHRLFSDGPCTVIAHVFEDGPRPRFTVSLQSPKGTLTIGPWPLREDAGWFMHANAPDLWVYDGEDTVQVVHLESDGDSRGLSRRTAKEFPELMEAAPKPFLDRLPARLKQ